MSASGYNLAYIGIIFFIFLSITALNKFNLTIKKHWTVYIMPGLIM